MKAFQLVIFFGGKSSPKPQTFAFWMPSMAQKRLCLSSLITKHTKVLYLHNLQSCRPPIFVELCLYCGSSLIITSLCFLFFNGVHVLYVIQNVDTIMQPIYMYNIAIYSGKPKVIHCKYSYRWNANLMSFQTCEMNLQQKMYVVFIVVSFKTVE